MGDAAVRSISTHGGRKIAAAISPPITQLLAQPVSPPFGIVLDRERLTEFSEAAARLQV
jgi:hypothetical protein